MTRHGSHATEQPTRAACVRCRHFQGGPALLEAAFKGLASLGSGYASVCADDGLCDYHDCHVTARTWCRQFELAEQASPRRARS